MRWRGAEPNGSSKSRMYIYIRSVQYSTCSRAHLAHVYITRHKDQPGCTSIYAMRCLSAMCIVSKTRDGWKKYTHSCWDSHEKSSLTYDVCWMCEQNGHDSIEFSLFISANSAQLSTQKSEWIFQFRILLCIARRAQYYVYISHTNIQFTFTEYICDHTRPSFGAHANPIFYSVRRSDQLVTMQSRCRRCRRLRPCRDCVVVTYICICIVYSLRVAHHHQQQQQRYHITCNAHILAHEWTFASHKHSNTKRVHECICCLAASCRRWRCVVVITCRSRSRRPRRRLERTHSDWKCTPSGMATQMQTLTRTHMHTYADCMHTNGRHMTFSKNLASDVGVETRLEKRTQRNPTTKKRSNHLCWHGRYSRHVFDFVVACV